MFAIETELHATQNERFIEQYLPRIFRGRTQTQVRMDMEKRNAKLCSLCNMDLFSNNIRAVRVRPYSVSIIRNNCVVAVNFRLLPYLAYTQMPTCRTVYLKISNKQYYGTSTIIAWFDCTLLCYQIIHIRDHWFFSIEIITENGDRE